MATKVLSGNSSGAVGPAAQAGGARGKTEDTAKGYSSNVQPDQIIHRSANCIILAG